MAFRLFKVFNAKYCLYIYIKYMICKYNLLITFYNEPELIFFAHIQMVLSIAIKYEQFYPLLIICLHTVK